MGDNGDTEPSKSDAALKHSTIANLNASETRPSQSETSPFLSLGRQNIFLWLIGFRLLNTLTVQTFFQPDEYFQALEPAWRLAFGKDAGAWITWEWNRHLRSAIHPAIFGFGYRGAQAIAELFKLEPHARAELLLASPKALQGFFAALGDLYTWKLASCVYGANSTATLATFCLTVISPWQWFCSTRTFSNSMETTLTIVALYNWPWHWQLPLDKPDIRNIRVRDDVDGTDEVTRLRRALLCAAVATVLRPTNILIWASLTMLTFLRGWRSIGPTWVECPLFMRETILCGGLILLLSAIVDRIFYDTWAFPPLNFLRVNVVQSLATFYGNNDWHYYISQGYPLLLTTALPFTLVGLYRSLNSNISTSEVTSAGHAVLRSLSIICLLVPACFSIIAHKEVRFIYPLLPALHIVTGLPLSLFFGSRTSAQQSRPSRRLARRVLLVLLVGLNVSISYYTTQIHNSGIIQLTHYLRNEFETTYLPVTATTFRAGVGLGAEAGIESEPGSSSGSGSRLGMGSPTNMTIGMLMPCHSTPWRSHLQYPPTSYSPGIHAWALTCDPPLDLPLTERATYLDEADQFYADPGVWLKKHMSRDPPRSKHPRLQAHSNGISASTQNRRSNHAVLFNSETPSIGLGRSHNQHQHQNHRGDHEQEDIWWTTRQGRRPWPEYLVFFAQLEPTLSIALRGSGYGECRRFFNSHWHDDWRRTGDVVVWCLDPPPPPPNTKQNMGDRTGVEPGNRASSKVLVDQDAFQDAIRDPHAQRGVSQDEDNIKKQELKRTEKKAQKMQEKQNTQTKKSSSVTRVVEKPFWKVRDEPDQQHSHGD
ncbi:hypothetical protein A1O1_09068 [Capronia coronata CBS 617.96]|uniref:Mannosyltransferase n=1 Tax=Capronia coronata CBS 617.96 TaxID=1182541 RepID=W9XDW0_9EURO|nr:uncharacterized protein A1O1_09068 [Capronia coronata CBS 617.96]EXJ78667.1 hypothetical protein A1O1_09068 [Capronia coronata CBS 617.96]